jgi:hypothetical protein
MACNIYAFNVLSTMPSTADTILSFIYKKELSFGGLKYTTDFIDLTTENSMLM